MPFYSSSTASANLGVLNDSFRAVRLFDFARVPIRKIPRRMVSFPMMYFSRAGSIRHVWPLLLHTVHLADACLCYLFGGARRLRVATPNRAGCGRFCRPRAVHCTMGLLTAMEMAATAPVKILHHKLEAAAALSAMIATFYFALEYTSPGKWATRRNTLLLSLVTLGLMLLIATNDLHHLLWTRLWFDRVVRVERGPLNPLLLAWAILLPTLSVLLFLRLSLRSRGVYRRQALMLFIGAALPLLTFFLEPAGINPLAPLDPVILMWNVSSLLYALAIFRFHMLEVVPIGREHGHRAHDERRVDPGCGRPDRRPEPCGRGSAGALARCDRRASGRAGPGRLSGPVKTPRAENRRNHRDHPARGKSAEVLSGAGFPSDPSRRIPPGAAHFAPGRD